MAGRENRPRKGLWTRYGQRHGVVGALIGIWLLPQPGIHLGSGIVAAICDDRRFGAAERFDRSERCHELAWRGHKIEAQC